MNRAEKPSKRVNYDRIGPSYDQRFEDGQSNGVLTALQSLARDAKARRILEVGCGTGRWLDDLASEPRQAYGLDLSTGMLQQARTRSKRIALVQGRASRLAFSDAVFDLVVCVNAIHHFGDPRAFVGEAYRLLVPDGVFVIIGSDPHECGGSWYVYDYFPGTLETDLRRFPLWRNVADWMTTAGFESVERQLVQHILDHKIGREVVDDPFLRKHACSQLALLSDEAYAAGLGRIESVVKAASAAGERAVFPVDLTISALIGRASINKHSVRT